MRLVHSLNLMYMHHFFLGKFYIGAVEYMYMNSASDKNSHSQHVDFTAMIEIQAPPPETDNLD